jgi:hypothetical protein
MDPVHALDHGVPRPGVVRSGRRPRQRLASQPQELMPVATLSVGRVASARCSFVRHALYGRGGLLLSHIDETVHNTLV